MLVRKPETPPLGIHRYRRKSNIKIDFQQTRLVVADRTHFAQRQEFFKINMQLLIILRNNLPHGIRQDIVHISSAIIKYFLEGLTENT